MSQWVAKRLSIAILALVATSYVATSFFIGGDAFHGRESAGRFFVAHHDGAPEHEVSRLVFMLSVWEFRILVACWLIGMAAGALAFLKTRLAR